MSSVVAQIVRALAWALLTAFAVQTYFAGAFVFGALPLEFHRALGGMSALATLVTALLSLTTRDTRRVSKPLLAVLGVMVLQVVFVIVKPKLPGIAALHALNATVLIVLAYRSARRANVMVAERRQGSSELSVPAAVRTAA